MTGNLYLDLAISLAGIAVMVGVSWAMGAWRTVRLDDAGARDRLAFDEPDFRVARLLVGTDGKTAAALSESGETAFIFVMGDSLATRRFAPGAIEVWQNLRAIRVETAEIAKPTITLLTQDEAQAADWASALRG